jgi:hypothetical protein
MHITALAGGVGGARFIRGLRAHLDRSPALADSQVTVIGNTGDDISLFGLRVCPDLDTLLYTLGGGVHEGQGWGRADETHRVQGELAAYGAVPQWFALGDQDFGTHIVRSQWLGQGLSLSEVTARLATRWGLPERGITLLPMTDKAWRDMDRAIAAQSSRFHERLLAPSFPAPSLLGLALFRMSRTSIRLTRPEEIRDYTYFRDKGWFESDYWYPTNIGLTKKVVGVLFDWVAAQMSTSLVAKE